MNEKQGCYFRDEDYAGLSRRLLIDILDGLTVGFLCIASLTAFGGFLPKDLVLALWAAIFFCYFVLLKRSKLGTIGYRIAGVKIVGPDGLPPSLWSLFLRMLFLVLGPLNYLLDVIWLSADVHRQALRDKFAQTYVVKRNAEPAGRAKFLYRYYEICGYNFLFREIETERTSTQP